MYFVILFFKSNFFQSSRQTIQCLHFQCVLRWALTNVYTKVTTTSTWHRTFASLQKLLSWLFAVDSRFSPTCCPRQTLIWFVSIQASYKWNHKGCTFSCLASFTHHNVWDAFTLSCLPAVHFFSLLSSNPLFEYLVHHSLLICVPVHTHLDFLCLGLLQKKLP